MHKLVGWIVSMGSARAVTDFECDNQAKWCGRLLSTRITFKE